MKILTPRLETDDLSAHSGSFWLILAHSGSFWPFWLDSGSFWLILAQSGLILAHSVFWLILAHFGLFWLGASPSACVLGRSGLIAARPLGIAAHDSREGTVKQIPA